jgi:hypothetical protein
VSRIQSRSTIFIVATFIVAFLLPANMGAQSLSARLSGTIWDPSDNPTAGVILTAVEETTGWQSETVSDENGRYVFLSLRPGYYTVFTKARGYQQITRRGIYLPISGNVSESFTLDIASADETVEVEEPVILDSSDVYQDISRRDLDALPIYSRNPLTLAAHIPGIQTDGGAEEISPDAGARRQMTSLRVDGIESAQPITPVLGSASFLMSPESVESIHVITSGAKAEFGGTAGAYLGIISPLGGQKWHGTAFDYFSDKSLNAREYFSRISDAEQQKYRRNIFGGSLSGPLGNNRTLVFGHYEGRRMDSEITRNRLVLMDDSDDDPDNEDEGTNDEARAGVFRWRTPGTSAIQSFYIVDSPEDINPAVAEAISMLPSPNNTLIGDGLNTAGYVFTNPTHNNADQASVRIDHTLSGRHSIFFRANWSRMEATDTWKMADPTFPGAPEGLMRESSWAFTAGSHLTLNPHMINEFRAGYARPKMEYVRPDRSSQSMLLFNSFTSPRNPDTSSDYTAPYMEFTDTLTHQYNRHIFKYGASFRRTRQRITDYAGAYPNITFGVTSGNEPEVGPMGNDVISEADRLAFEKLYNDILGRIESISQTYQYNLTDFQPGGTAKRRDFSSFEIAGFVQDDWRIRPDLTLNLGVRYDFFSVPREKNGLQLVLDPASNIGPEDNYSDFTLVSSGDWRDKVVSNFAPRAGFAWDISGYGTFVLRGSFGMYYSRLPGSITEFIDQNTYGLSQTETTYPNLGGGDIRLGDEGVPYPTVPSEGPDLTLPSTRSASIAVFAPNLKTPRIDRFNLTLERRLTDRLVVDLSYISARGRNLYQNLNYNQVKALDGFLQDFEELKAFRDSGTPLSDSNSLLQMFGSAMAAWEAIGADSSGISYVDSNQAGIAADVIDRYHFDKYAAAGLSDYYLRNYPQFDTFIVGTDAGRSWYDALQFGFRANSARFA